MTVTKEMERKTLEKIRQMVAELGTDSYLAAAFDGAFEIAEQNIENDFGCTTREYIDAAHNAEEKFRKEREETTKQIASLKRELETKTQNETVLKRNAEYHEKQLVELNETLVKVKREAESYKVMIEDLECDVMKLKAKLYDYMTGEVK